MSIGVAIAAGCGESSNAIQAPSVSKPSEPASPTEPDTASAPSTPAAPESPITPTTPTTNSWTFCVNAGNVCVFDGLRDVRLTDATGEKSVIQTAFSQVPCAVYGFDDQNPAPNQALHCDYGPVKMGTMSNPKPGMAGLPATVTVPLGSAGAAGPVSHRVGGAGDFADFGAFRTQCSLAKFAFDDPIVFPGQPGVSHLHMFFGNRGVDAYSSTQTIVSTGNSTCGGGTLNRTGYWTPAVFDKTTGVVQTPAEATIYYKSGYNIDYTKIQPMPTGLRMIAGDKDWSNTKTAQQHLWWECTDKDVGFSPTIPSCAKSTRLLVIFPQCWDGKNLDSPDHKSHMAYPIYANSRFGSRCPSTHPVTLPEVTEIFEFPIPKGGNIANWRLSSDMDMSKPAGMSAHADWMMGWDPATMSTLVTQCLNKGLDCGVGFIGNGTEILQQFSQP